MHIELKITCPDMSEVYLSIPLKHCLEIALNYSFWKETT